MAADHFIPSADSRVSASSSLGIDGTVEISAPEVDLSGGLEALPARFFDAAALLKERCGVRAGRAMSSLIKVGRGGLPLAPEALFSNFPLSRGGCSALSANSP
jgi:large exoprotein involved in heme utilization and adhesion